MLKSLYVVMILFIVTLFGAGCADNQQIKTPNKGDTSLNPQGQLVFVNKQGAISNYAGEVIVSGKYYYSEFGSQVCFMADEQSQAVLPGEDKEFCFENSDDAAKIFYGMGVDNLLSTVSAVGEDRYMNPKDATVRISGYKEHANPEDPENVFAADGKKITWTAGMSTDLSTFVEVVKKQTKTYSFKDFGVSFEYPPEFNIIETSPRALYITTNTQLSDGDASFFFTGLQIEYGTLGEHRAKLMSEPGSNPTRESVKIADYEFDRVSFHSDYGGSQMVYYLYQLPDGVFEYKVGEGEQALADNILPTLNFVSK